MKRAYRIGAVPAALLLQIMPLACTTDEAGGDDTADASPTDTSSEGGADDSTDEATDDSTDEATDDSTDEATDDSTDEATDDSSSADETEDDTSSSEDGGTSLDDAGADETAQGDDLVEDEALDDIADEVGEDDTLTELDAGTSDAAALPADDAGSLPGDAATDDSDAGSTEEPVTDEPSPDDDAGGGVAELLKVGTIALTQTQTTVPVVGTIIASGAAGSFVASTPVQSDTCTTVTLGDCQVTECEGEAASGNSTQYNAGTITVTGFDEPLELDWQESFSGYASAATTGWMWTDSHDVTLTVEGSADVPAYSLPLTLPSPIAVTSPVAGNALAISKAAGFAATWTGGAEGTVQVSLSSSGNDASYSVSCGVDASAGELEIEPDLLAGLGADAAVTVGLFTAEIQSVEDWTMVFEALDTRYTQTATVTD